MTAVTASARLSCPAVPAAREEFAADLGVTKAINKAQRGRYSSAGVAVAIIYLWPLAAVVLLYAIYRVLGVHPHLLNYVAALIAICAIAIVWWWHMVRHNNML
jgi:hypothetical protein